MNKKTIAILMRVALGAIFIIFGLNGFLHFISMPPLPDQAAKFMMGLGQSGYFFPLLKATEIVCGILILSGAFLPLGLVVLAPIVLHIVLFHLFLEPSGLPFALFTLILELGLAWVYKDAFQSILKKDHSI